METSLSYLPFAFFGMSCSIIVITWHSSFRSIQALFGSWRITDPSRSNNLIIIKLLFYYCYVLTLVNTRVILSSISSLMSHRASSREMNLLLLGQSRSGPEAYVWQFNAWVLFLWTFWCLSNTEMKRKCQKGRGRSQKCQGSQNRAPFFFFPHSPAAGTCRPGKISPMVENARLKQESCCSPAQWEVLPGALLSWQKEEVLEKWPLSSAISFGEAVVSLSLVLKGVISISLRRSARKPLGGCGEGWGTDLT